MIAVFTSVGVPTREQCDTQRYKE